MKTLTVICPSRGRPILIRDMLDSFMATSNDSTRMVVYISQEDPALAEYKKTIKKYNPLFVKFVIGPRKHITEVYNMFSVGDSSDYFSTLNDDHFFVTKDWDRKLIEIVETQGQGWGIAGADDKLTNWAECKHPSGCVISGNIVQTLGYLMHPSLRHIGTDTYLMKISEGINRLFLTRDVVIEHRHWINGIRKMDDNYKWVYGKEEQEHGAIAVRNYLFNHYENDIKKLKEAMEKDGVKV